MLEEEENRRKKVEAMAEAPRAGRQEEGRPSQKEERCKRRKPV